MKLMVILLILLLAFQNSDVLSQVLEVKNLPYEGTLLNNGWRYKVGDHADWSTENFDDRNWQRVDPTLDIHQLPMLWKNSIVWFRLHLSIDSSMVGNLAMAVTHAGASEIYLDGKLINRFGVVSQDLDLIKAYNPQYEPPISFPAKGAGHHVISVRFVLESGVFYTTEWNNKNLGPAITLNTFKNALRVYNNTQIFDEKGAMFRISATLLLALIFLTFHLINPKHSSNLIFFAYSVAWFFTWVIFSFRTAWVKHYYFYANTSLIIQVIGHLLLIIAIYKLFGRQRNWAYYFLVTLGLLCIPAGLFVYPSGWFMFSVCFMSLVNVNILQTASSSLKSKEKGSLIIFTGAALGLVTWLFFLSLRFGVVSSSFNMWYIFSVHHISIPLSVAIYLGYELGFSNKNLADKLNEVRVLSAEKAEILTKQSEYLEEQVAARTDELHKTIKELKSTQSQLIQSERMASLGELTAGIAHEIQNPLNFVNNFSEVNTELIKEIQDERNKKQDQRDEQFESDLLKDISENMVKINHHGKRAADIVKGMLQHSRTSAGQKELTDINALCDEYLRLSYHGLRAKDKSFNAKFETDFDSSLPKINVIPQDIGRVILNLINNAFYAVNEKAKQGTAGYEPTVTVTTKLSPLPGRGVGGEAIITVKDNGNGIPDSIKEKIFQPFFTTKPTGQGTGLGLSLSYDIVKAHSGELRVETQEGKGSEFIIQLPIV